MPRKPLTNHLLSMLGQPGQGVFHPAPVAPRREWGVWGASPPRDFRVPLPVGIPAFCVPVEGWRLTSAGSERANSRR